MDPMTMATVASTGMDILGGIFGGKKMSPNMQMAKQYEYQRKLNQTSVQDRVADAQAAGIHPLYALGASLNPGGVSMPDQSGSSLGDRLSNMGQNISRSIMAKQSAEERKISLAGAALDLEGKKLQNDILREQLLNRRTQLPPSINNSQAIAGQGDVVTVDKQILPFGVNKGEEAGIEAGLKWVELPGIGPVRVRGKALEESLEDNHLANMGIDLGYFYPDIARNAVNAVRSSPTAKWLLKPTSEVLGFKKSSGKHYPRPNAKGRGFVHGGR